ncbi:myeloid leukemia factor 1 isoform X2 [Octopus sinensis]|uniref:Myeloid leukemia factor 1 isoform X2 n=1 Tax=Octopus sinensis TaxID=2607531 RepID=A0A6P7S4N1_9MOLL|nr:myeloid leukemia factor 1 isoform X2 [Octopus sinensis]
MFGRSILQEFQDDEFFGFPKTHMRMMDFGFSGREHIRNQQRSKSCERTNCKNDLVGFGLNEDYFGINDIFNNMRRMMAGMNHSLSNKIDPNGHHFSHSSFKTYSKIGNNAPKTYEATQSVTTAPGGLKQTYKFVRDSERGYDKMAVGRHIKERAFVEERSRNTTGLMERNNHYINMDEGDMTNFCKEWQQRTLKTGIDRPWYKPINRNPKRQMITDGIQRRSYRT